MTTAELKAIRMQAELTFPTTSDRYQIRNARGIIVAFDLTQDRANDWAQFHAGATVERMTK